MKRIYTIIIMAVLIMGLYAQKDLLIHTNDGKVYKEKISRIDSINIAESVESGSTESNGHEYVDLGLPSGTLWATCNVGAEHPYEVGDPFAWGETATKEEFTSENYTYTGTTGLLAPENDAATVLWGGSWRMPTKAEFEELRVNCTGTLSYRYGTMGLAIYGPNGKSIFMPYGAYWGKSYSSQGRANILTCASRNGLSLEENYVQSGNYIRPVMGDDPISSQNSYTVTAVANYTAMGSVTGSGSYYEFDQVTLTATANDGYWFKEWSDGNTENPRWFMLTSDTTFTAVFEKNFEGWPTSGSINNHEYVDLGLPSGLLWATCNVGAENPKDYGNYYAWGETTTKSNYSWSTYKYGSDWDALTKYNTDSYYGTVDNKTVLDPEDDAAHVNWGGAWRMPTSEEIDELINNCTWEWTTIDGKNGYKVTSNAENNNNYIFLPAAGGRYDGSLYDDGSCVYYWSSSLYSDYPESAWGLVIGRSAFGRNILPRYSGYSVRAVCPAGSN